MSMNYAFYMETITAETRFSYSQMYFSIVTKRSQYICFMFRMISSVSKVEVREQIPTALFSVSSKM